MHLIEEYEKHSNVKGSTQEKNKQESAAMRKTSNSAVKGGVNKDIEND